MTGNRLGSKSAVIYQTDVPAIVYILNRDDDLLFAGLGAGAGTPDLYDPETPPAGKTVLTPPKRFKPRIVFAESGTDGARKELIAFDPTASLYTSTQRTAVPEFDGDNTFVTTGRKGEKLSF